MKKLSAIILALSMILSLFSVSAFAEKGKNELAGRDEPSTGSIPFRIYGEWGNNELYDLDAAEVKPDSPLRGKTIYWLGSSVTYGAASRQQSMVDYIAKIDQCNCVKNAVSGTTLRTGEKNPEKSYVSRMLNPEWGFHPEDKIDAFVCQISTNDTKAENESSHGQLRDSYENCALSDFDLSTSLDSVAYVIQYVHDTWNCPVFFYAGSWFGDEGETRGNKEPSGSNYDAFIREVTEIAEKYDSMDGYTVKVLDLFHNEEFNNLVTDSDYAYLMGDAIHPRQAGYLVWWVPYFEEFLYEQLA